MRCGTLSFNFYKKNTTTPRNYFSFPRGKSVYAKTTFDLVGQFFLKMMLEVGGGGTCLNGGSKKIQGGEEIYNGWCHDVFYFQVTNSKSKNKKFNVESLTRRLNFYFFYFRFTNSKLKNKKLHFELLTWNQK